MARRPLEDARILDLSRMLTGDYGSMILGDLGADVIKIEPPEGGDPLRRMPPHFVEGESAYFLSINRNKRSLTLDLRKDEGRAVFHALVGKSDVVFDNFRPGVLERLGADHETLRKINPRIISCSISSFGQDGPYASQPAFDLTIQALAGAMAITGEPGRLPARMGIPMGDLAGSMFAAYSISAALYSRERTGEGSRIDLSLLDCLASMLTYVAQYYFSGGEVAEPQGSGHMSVVPYGAFATKDRPIVIAIFVEKFWTNLCDVVGLPEMGRDERLASTAGRLTHRDEVNSRLGERFLTDTQEGWIRKLMEARIPCAPILGIDQVPEDEQIQHRDMVVEVEHPTAGKLRMLGDPVKISPEPEGEHFRPPPLLGEHIEEVLRDVLGYSEARIAALKDVKVI
jgi:crotonobetainyl-CoA:carnitine CoA-transferase CaiB-like acyl-CoA transferase